MMDLSQLDPTDRLLVAGLVVATIAAVIYTAVRSLNERLDRRAFRRTNQAHPAEWDR